MSRSNWIVGAVLASIVAGCATLEQLAPPVEQIVLATDQREEQGLGRLRLGRELYVSRCARCHSPEAVTAYTQGQWRGILPRMAEMAKLSVDQRQAVTEYIQAVLAATIVDPLDCHVPSP